MFRPFQTKLLEQQNQDGANGGGDGNAAGAADPNELAKLVNQAVTSQLTRMLPKALETATGKMLSTLDEKLAAFQPQPKTGEGQGSQGGAQDDAARRIAELEKANQRLVKSIEDSERRAKDAETKSRTDNALATMRSQLTGKVKPEFLEFVVGQLHKVEDRLSFGEDGSPLLRVATSAYKGAPPEDNLFTLQEGVEQWLKTDSAKLFIPPPQPTKGAPIGGRFPQPRTANNGATQGGPKTLEEMQAAFPDVKFDDFT